MSHNNTGNSSSSPQMFYFNTIFLQVVSAGAAVTPAFILHRPFLFHLFVSAPLLPCLIKPACDWNVSTRLLRGSPALLSLLVISTRCGSLSQRDEALEGARLHVHLRLNQRLSLVSYLTVVGEAVRYCRSSFVRRPDKTDGKPAWSHRRWVPLRQKANKASLFPFLCSWSLKIPTCRPLFAPNSNIWIILVTALICRLLSGGVF